MHLFHHEYGGFILSVISLPRSGQGAQGRPNVPLTCVGEVLCTHRSDYFLCNDCMPADPRRTWPFWLDIDRMPERKSWSMGAQTLLYEANAYLLGTRRFSLSHGPEQLTRKEAWVEGTWGRRHRKADVRAIRAQRRYGCVSGVRYGGRRIWYSGRAIVSIVGRRPVGRLSRIHWDAVHLAHRRRLCCRTLMRGAGGCAGCRDPVRL